MSDYIIAVTKSGIDVNTETNPNNFVFHSDYNTFKIIKTGVVTCNVIGSANGQVFTRRHALPFAPLVTAFAKDTAQQEVFAVNTEDIYWYGWKAGIFGTGIKFVSVAADYTNLYFKFDNTGAAPKTIKVRYFCLEGI